MLPRIGNIYDLVISLSPRVSNISVPVGRVLIPSVSVEVYQNWIISEHQNGDTTWYQIF